MTEQQLNHSYHYLKQYIKRPADLAIILGSGLGSFAASLDKKIEINTSDIPFYPKSTVEGHQGKIIYTNIKGRNILILQGRVHIYEGYSMQQTTCSIRIMSLLGVKKLLITNAAGGINKKLSPGDLMLLKDHINFTFRNPLIGQNRDRFGTRFPNKSSPYEKKYLLKAKKIALENKIDLKQGVYCGLLGPSYETPAEIRMLKFLGADAVGMSTVSEVIVAKHCGMNVLGITCITNMGSGISPKPLNHDEVTEVGEKTSKQFTVLLKKLLPEI